ncbi:hypothetical protein BGP_4595 [Beggiatoa sp. PS]|nr:hypothetical protein BGP_4595 [Beggiatoa sp. PS]
MIVGHTKFAPDGYFGLIKKNIVVQKFIPIIKWLILLIVLLLTNIIYAKDIMKQMGNLLLSTGIGLIGYKSTLKNYLT